MCWVPGIWQRYRGLLRVRRPRSGGTGRRCGAKSANFARATRRFSSPASTNCSQSGLAAGRFGSPPIPRRHSAGADILWVAYDTPVDDEDRADVEFVVQRVVRLFPHLRGRMLVLIASQMPVGSTARLEQMYVPAFPARL